MSADSVLIKGGRSRARTTTVSTDRPRGLESRARSTFVGREWGSLRCRDGRAVDYRSRGCRGVVDRPALEKAGMVAETSIDRRTAWDSGLLDILRITYSDVPFQAANRLSRSV